MKVYVAAPYAARDGIQWLRDMLERGGHTITSRWLLDAGPITDSTTGAAAGVPEALVVRGARDDFEDIDDADVVVLLTGETVGRLFLVSMTKTTSGGRHVEVGYALATGTPVVVWGAPENVFQRAMCLRVSSLSGLLETLSDLLTKKEARALPCPAEPSHH